MILRAVGSGEVKVFPARRLHPPFLPGEVRCVDMGQSPVTVVLLQVRPTYLWISELSGSKEGALSSAGVPSSGPGTCVGTTAVSVIIAIAQ